MKDSDSELQKRDIKNLLKTEMDLDYLETRVLKLVQFMKESRMNDTTQTVEQYWFHRLASLSGEERMKMTADSFESARAVVLSSLKAHGSESEAKKHLLLRFYGGDLSEGRIDGFLKRVNSE
jgi:hypothetical protein